MSLTRQSYIGSPEGTLDFVPYLFLAQGMPLLSAKRAPKPASKAGTRAIGATTITPWSTNRWSHLSRDDHRETEVEVVPAMHPRGRSGEANPAAQSGNGRYTGGSTGSVQEAL